MSTSETFITDNIPLLDEMNESLRNIVLNCVIKNEQEGFDNETLESASNYNNYVECLQGRSKFELFKYSVQDYREMGVLEDNIKIYLLEPNKVPPMIKEALRKKKTEEILNNYEEKNNYYRMLMGLPPLGEEGIYIYQWQLPDTISKKIDLGTGKLVHTLSEYEIALLYSFNVIDDLLAEHPECKYLKYMGNKSIDFYKARTAPRFSLLYLPDDEEAIILSRFKDVYDKNRVYTLKTIYSDAFKYGSDYYDNFIQMFICIETMVDMIVEIPNMIIKRDIFDMRTVELIFKSNGVDTFKDIPFKYQLAMCRNLNRLIKYKSTSTCIVDICSLFGFENITIFKYFLLKDRKKDANGDFLFKYKDIMDEDGNIKTVEDIEGQYELKFVKVPLDDIMDNVINSDDPMLTEDYDEVTNADKYWDGDLDHNYVRKQILEHEFNYLQSKYISIDTLVSMTQLSFEMIYFYNMIFDNNLMEEDLLMNAPCIMGTVKFRFIDIICYLFALMHEYNETKDNIMDMTSKVLYVKGFNFKADMAELALYVKEQGFTMEELGVAGFKTPEHVLSYNQMMEVFTNNKKIYDHVVKQLTTANNKKIYDIYKKIYDSLMIVQLTDEFFTKSDGTIAKSYTEYLEDKDLILYNSLQQIRAIEKPDLKSQTILDMIDNTVYYLEEYINSDEYKFLFANLPSRTIDSMNTYLYRVIDFFKSYKIQIDKINTIYLFDDRYENMIVMIDNVIIKHVLYLNSHVETRDKFKHMRAYFDIKEDDIINEKVYIYVCEWISKLFQTDEVTRDKLTICARNIIEEHTLNKTIDLIKLTSNITTDYTIGIHDNVFISSTSVDNGNI